MRNLGLIKKSSILFLATLMMSVIFTGCNKDDDDDEDSSSTIGNWVDKSSLVGDKRSGAASFVIGTDGYIVGGYFEDGDDYATDAWVYDSENNSWKEVASLDEAVTGTETVAGRNGAVGFSINGKGYIGLGYDGDQRLNDFYEYDPATDTWTKIADFGGTARYGAVAFSIGGYGYVGTGYDGSAQKDFWKYDPTTNTWEEVEQSFGGDKRQDASVFVIDDVAYIAGGTDNGSYETDFFSFDGESWTELSDIDSDDDNQVFIYNSVGFSLDGKGYLATGFAGAASSVVWEYNPSSDSWSSKATFEGSSREDASAFTFEDSAYVLLGRNGDTQYDDIWFYEPNAEQDTDD